MPVPEQPEPIQPKRRSRRFRVTAVLATGALLVAGGTTFAYGLGQPASGDAGSAVSGLTAAEPTTSPGATGDTSGGPTSTPTPLPPAPADLAAKVKAVYASVYHAANRVTSTGDGEGADLSQLKPLPDFDAMIDSLTPQQLSEVYAAIEANPGWLDMPKTYDDVTAPSPGAGEPDQKSSRKAPQDSSEKPQQSGTTTSLFGQGAPGPTTMITPRRAVQLAARMAVGLPAFPDPEPEPTGELPEPPSAFDPAQLQDAGAEDCPSLDGVLEGYLAVKITAATAAGAALAVPAVLVALGESFPDPARIALEAVSIAAEIVEASLDYAVAKADACDANYQDKRLGNIDENLVKTFALATQNQNTIAQVNKAVNLVHDQAHLLIKTQLAQLKLDLQQALSLPPGQIPNIAYELPSTADGYLDTTPVGVQALVTDALANAQKAGVPINPASKRYLSQANQELGDGHYKEAYVDFQRAYSEMAR